MNYHSYAKKSTVSTVNHDQIPMNPTVSITLSITISCYFHHYQLLLRPPGLLFKSTNVYKFCSLHCAKLCQGDAWPFDSLDSEEDAAGTKRR